jgi:hypothetical protein
MKLHHALVAAALTAVAAAPALAQSKGGRAAAVAVKTTATVVAVDHKNRVAALKGPGGNVVEVHVGPNAQNFDQVQVGDKVDVEFLEAIAAEVKPAAGNTPGFAVVRSDERAGKGDPAAGMITSTVFATARVDAIDRQARTVTITGPRGRSVAVKVPDDSPAFDKVKKGDLVSITYFEGLAMALRKQ